MKKKTLLATLMVAILSVSVLFGCGSSTEESKTPAGTKEPTEAATDPATEASTEAVQTQKDGLNTVIFDNEYVTVTVNSISLHEMNMTVKNKSDVDFSIMISDLILDGEDYGSSESCWDAPSGEESENIFYSESVELNINASKIAGTIQFIDDGDVYGGEQKEIDFEEVDLK